MKTVTLALAPLAALALVACGETENTDMDMSNDAVAPGPAMGGEGPDAMETGTVESPAPEPFAPLDEQPEATPTPEQ